MTANEWIEQKVPDLTGKTIIITGANSGLGFEVTKAFASKGAQVVMACRNAQKAEEAKSEVLKLHPKASLDVLALNLASLKSIQEFAEAVIQKYPAIHILCNNAGVMALPYRQTEDGFEMQIGTNHLGHFALTGRLIGHLSQTPKARVVTVSSGMHQFGRMNFEDLQGQRLYSKWAAYSQSKLANLLFAYELQRKFQKKNQNLLSVAAHPGYSNTNLQTTGPQMAHSVFPLESLMLTRRSPLELMA